MFNANEVIERIKGQAFYTNHRSIRVTLSRIEMIEILETANLVWESRLDQAKFGTAVAQLDVALNIISEEILKEAKRIGWDLSALPETPSIAMTGSQKSGPSTYLSFGVVVP
ncbi:hypothetical protein PS2_187 [Serratia phage PS2]|uniref:Uncharacterized protein n=1 Tax=Serratia phage PS2 TaxID=1481112 RepID=A0A023W512_9CAUD|nr:hypothetical protein FF83_gp228 [Serratia phage PS2]AHY25429.1 hypothetical protein PS2_187 [Serratia phage PS2]